MQEIVVVVVLVVVVMPTIDMLQSSDTYNEYLNSLIFIGMRSYSINKSDK